MGRGTASAWPRSVRRRRDTVTRSLRTEVAMPLAHLPSTRPKSDTLVMLGITGDLAKKKLIPAVYRLHCRGLLGIPVVGLARPDWSPEDLANHVEASLHDAGEKFDQDQYDSLMKTWSYVSGDYNDPDTFVKLKTTVG